MNHFARLICISFFSLVSPFSNAQPEATTPIHTAQIADETLSSVTVITRRDIENSHALTIPEMLRGVAGLDMTIAGGLGKKSVIYMRGTESDHISVFIDEIEIGSAIDGTVSFEHLPLSHIERIEIIRGPHMGKNIGGSIYIFTRRNQQQPIITLSSGIGPDSSLQLKGGISGTVQNTWFSLYGDYLQTEYVNCAETTCSGDDAYENTSYNMRLGHQFGTVFSLEAYALRLEGNTQETSFNEDFFQDAMGLKAELFLNNWWKMTLNMGNSAHKSDISDNTDSSTSFFYTDRNILSFKNKFLLSKMGTIFIGYEYQNDEVESHTAYRVKARNNQGLFAQYHGKFSKFSLNAAVRQDDNEQFGTYMTGNLGFAYALKPTLNVVMSYGTAFKAPVFDELYHPEYGNSTLEPEESDTIELALKGDETKSPQEHYKWSIGAYQTKINQLIDTSSTGMSQNLNQASIMGIEYSFQWQRDGWEFNSTGTWLKAEDEATGLLLPHRADQSFWMEVAERRGPTRLAVSWLMQGERYDDVENTTLLEGYDIWTLTGDYYFNKHWALRFRVENLADTQYQTVQDAPMAGRFWFSSLECQY